MEVVTPKRESIYYLLIISLLLNIENKIKYRTKKQEQFI